MSEALEKLEKVIDEAPEGVVKVYLTRDPKGKRAPLPPLELRRDLPFEDQLWDHVLANASEGGLFALRVRLDGQHLAQDTVPFEFKGPRVPNPASFVQGPAAPVPPTPSAIEQIRGAKELLTVLHDATAEDDGDDEDAVEELVPTSAAVTLLGTLLENEDVKQGAAGLFLETGNWIGSDAKRRLAMANKLDAEAEMLRARVEQMRSGRLVSHGQQAGPKVVGFVPRVVRSEAGEEAERAASAGHES